MLKKFRAKIAALLVAVAAVTGIGLVTAAPAEAASWAANSYCPWGWKSGVRVSVFSGTVTVAAYTPGGAYIGSRSGRSIDYRTGYEDIYVHAYGDVVFSGYSTYCYI